ncbi:sulfite exporter TauE/SafE family protein [Sphingomonas sp. SORGH_AS_0879]|uniref:sulfite exporter TauE/SafE family protein n=1 Tax=Sphingomonas sp. SORGH_AS_0879 TaxID=3041790 RepID=UPI00277D3A2E|nr:sulfite exporter TauE/SafE family protein [Sphingomonas sp. SORGH_AS_0879]MDQ1232388.1 putative membrane protein YfcA [Sphingomonas sp. SORGH_AS_0879]
MIDWTFLALAAAGGFLGGAMNALAGGGSFSTMPTLIALGLPSTVANATSNVALQPAAMASAWAYRHGLEPVMGVTMRRMVAITMIGAFLGSALLFFTSPRAFDLIVPWLLLTATLAIAGGRHASDWLARIARPGPRALMTAQGVLGVYGGYFGGGIGMMLTAAWGLLSGRDPAQLAAPRTLMLATANAAATLVFIATGMVAWAQCLPMLAGGIVGGWSGALVGRKLPAGLIRGWTLLLTTVTTAVFFYRGYA